MATRKHQPAGIQQRQKRQQRQINVNFIGRPAYPPPDYGANSGPDYRPQLARV